MEPAYPRVSTTQTTTLASKRNVSLYIGFEIVDSHKFMFSHIAFPGEKLIERLFGPLGLRLVMANQLLVGRRKQHVKT